MKHFLLFILIVVLFVFTPIFSIWAVNTLFSTVIPITFWTWLSALWLGSVLGSGRLGKAIKDSLEI